MRICDVLSFIRDHPASDAMFRSIFLDMVHAPSRLSFPLIQFCMHELRWPEIAEAARAVAARDRDTHAELWMGAILKAYSPSWSGRLYYDYYSTGRHAEEV